MYLGPHHFQAQARYFEDPIHFAASSLWFAGYGLAACELDAEAMNNGTLSLVRARGILPDGLAFEMPDCDPLPAARNITESFPPLADRLTIYLGVPAYRPNAVNCTPPEGQRRCPRPATPPTGRSCRTRTPAGTRSRSISGGRTSPSTSRTKSPRI